MKHSSADDRSLRFLSTCSLCQEPFAAPAARELSRAGDARLMHATCQKCGVATLALVMDSETGGGAVGLVTDLSHDDVMRVRTGRRVSSDDVIDAHTQLSGDLASVLRVSVPNRRPRAKAKAKARRGA